MPFILIDLVNLRSISIDLEEETVWIETGATVGELYYRIAKESKVHASQQEYAPVTVLEGTSVEADLGQW